MDRTVTIDDVKDRTLDDLLTEVAQSHDTITVVMPEGQSVLISPGQILKPLQRFRGTTTTGWKDALYGG
jgi:hypothetical protein